MEARLSVHPGDRRGRGFLLLLNKREDAAAPLPELNNGSPGVAMTCKCPQVPNAVCDMEKDYSEEASRMESYDRFPISCPISAPALARAGFYYTGVQDRVECFSCGAAVEGWQHGDTAIGKHRKISPNCRFINSFNARNAECIQTQVSNLRMECNGASNDINHLHDGETQADFMLRTGQVVDETVPEYPKYLNMCTEEARLKTFTNWPDYTPVTPKDLANAGLFYYGMNDQVKCFCCGGKLMNWEPGDIPWSEHRRHFPDCFFVLGRDVGNVELKSNSARRISEVPEYPAMGQYKARLDTFQDWTYPIYKETLARAGFFSTGEQDATKCFYCGGELKDWLEGDEPWEMHARWYPGCKFVLDEKGQLFINTVQLIRPRRGRLPSFEKPPALLENNIEEKIRKLEAEKTCKVCMDKALSVVFIPCGHLVTCEDCADNLEKCPICCTIIQRRQKIFMS